MSDLSFDTTTSTFERDVIEASKSRPIVVDFWASWCGPCRALKPILEKLAKEYGGKFALAKLDTDANPEIAARYGVRGIPNVKAFVDGDVVNEFVGALPESGVRAFLDALVPSPGEALRRESIKALAAGDFDAAEAGLRKALSLDPASVAIRTDLAELLVARRDFLEAEDLLGAVPGDEPEGRLARLRAQIDAWRAGQGLPSADELRRQLAEEPEDLTVRMQLAERLIADAQHARAMDQLLEIVRRDRGAMREQARQALVRVFSLASGEPEVVREYRRRLASLLN